MIFTVPAIATVKRWALQGIIVVGALLLAGGFGFLQGRANCAKFEGGVAAIGKLQSLKVEETERRSAVASKEDHDAWIKNLNALHKYYGERLRDVSSGSRGVPKVPSTSPRADGAAKNQVPANPCGNELQQLRSQLAKLELESAETTLQLIQLQNWVNRQQEIFGGAH